MRVKSSIFFALVGISNLPHAEAFIPTSIIHRSLHHSSFSSSASPSSIIQLNSSPGHNRNRNDDSNDSHSVSNRYDRRRRTRSSQSNDSSSSPQGFYDRKSKKLSSAQYRHELKEGRAWLETTTTKILQTEPGSLQKGKWHELVSMYKAWSKYSRHDPQAPLIMERLLKRLIDERKYGNNEAAKADIEMYNLLLDAWACSAIFFTQRQQKYNQKDPVINASQRAREILVLLQETFERDQDHDLKPNADSFAIVFDAVLKTEDPTTARRVLAWMEYLVKMGRNDAAQPRRRHYVLLLDAYANSRVGNAGQLAEGCIRHMKAMGVQPDTTCYNIAIKAWIKAKRGRESAEHADRILDEMDADKDLVTYSSVISAWAASGMKAHAVTRAEELLRAIEETPGLEPNTVVLNSVMSTWVKSRNPAAANRTAELLEVMKGLEGAQPDLISYNTHIHALAIHAKRSGYAERANQVLLDMEKMYENKELPFRPNLFSYNTVIDAWSKSLDYDAAWKAVRVLRRLIDEDGPEPDSFSFNQVLSSLSRSSKPGAAILAEKLLKYMDDAYRMQIHKNARPDVFGYTSVIIALARCGSDDAPERAERLLNNMKERYAMGEKWMKPTRITYNALIDCWAKSGKGTFAARKAEALLQEMNDRFADGDVSVAPNIVTYNAVLNAWARSGTRCCANKAEEYLERMWELYNAGDMEIAPNDKSFNTVINAISKSQNKAKAQKALRILRRMDKLYQAGYKDARPNEVTYTSVLNSCAFPATLDQLTRRKALDTAIFTLQELRSSRYGQPNDVTYGTFIKACANLLSDDEKMLRVVVEEAFQQCCRDGQVGEMVLSYFREAAPEDLYRELLAKFQTSDSVITIKELPSEWSCNVRSNANNRGVRNVLRSDSLPAHPSRKIKR